MASMVAAATAQLTPADYLEQERKSHFKSEYIEGSCPSYGRRNV